MKLVYKIALMFIAIFFMQYSFAQKTLRLRVTQATSIANGHTDYDCDAVGDSDWQWTWDVPSGTQVACEYNNGSNSSQTRNIDKTLFGTNTYYSRDCWPTGNVSVVFRYQENDNIGDCDAGGSCSRSDNWTYPAYNASLDNYQQNGSSTGSTTYSGTCSSGCGRNFDYGMTGQWVVGGSNFSALNLDVNGYVSNKTCATAIALTANASGNLRTIDATQCTETWYSYYNSGIMPSLIFNPSQDGCFVEVFYSASGSCTDMCLVANGSGVATVRGTRVGTYFVKLSASGGGNTTLNVTRSSGTSNDNFNQATNITMNPGTTYNGSFNNSSYSNETNEPFAYSEYNSAWYKFITPANGLTEVTASISQNGGNNSFVTIYQKGATDNCTFSNLTDRAHDRWCASSGGSVTATCLPGNTTYYV